jgi:hypothetical protein
VIALLAGLLGAVLGSGVTLAAMHGRLALEYEARLMEEIALLGGDPEEPEPVPRRDVSEDWWPDS